LAAKPKANVVHLKFERFDLDEIAKTLLTTARDLGWAV
jgi:hypothetical protein